MIENVYERMIYLKFWCEYFISNKCWMFCVMRPLQDIFIIHCVQKKREQNVCGNIYYKTEAFWWNLVRSFLN